MYQNEGHQMPQIENITVLGSGVLGGQIAWHSAVKGKSVSVLDISEGTLNKCRAAHDHYAGIYIQDCGLSNEDIEAARSRLSYTTDNAAAVSQTDLVIEAVPEIPEIKRQAYAALAPLLPPHALIATNSSTLLPGDFAEATGRPEKYCALHFANLIWMMNIVEVMAHPGTSLETLNSATQFGIEIGMRPIPVQKEQNGYVVNTWFVALLNASQTLVTNGVSTHEDVDRSFLICNRGTSMGPMALLDVVGMETAFNILQHWGNENSDAQMLKNAQYIKTRFIDKGLLGLHAGEGYYRYPDPSYQREGFLDVPDVASAPELAARAFLGD
jgi:3-hydroxybutyryl-CoA dehydrogenase